MALYTVRILKGASREFARLNKPVARRIVERIRWLVENLDKIRPQALKGDLAGGREKRYYCFGKVRGGILTVRFTYRGGVIRIFGAGYWRKGKAIYERENKVQR